MSDKRRRQRRMIIEPLEPRLLFSATTDALLLDDFGTDAADLQEAADNTDLTQVYALQNPFDGSGEIENAATDTNGLLELRDEPIGELEEEPRQPLQEIVFIDTAVDDYQQLLDDILENSSAETDVVLLDSGANGVDQITETLANYSGIAAVHIISHGSAGALQLGNAVLNPDAVANYSDELISWREALGENADILLYGCELTSAQAGVDLINQIALYTGADIAASNDDTGHQSFGGDWELETIHGTIEADLAVDNSTQETWLGLLADINHINTGDGLHNLPVSSANHMGQSFTYTSGDGTYVVNEISIQLARYASAQPQTVTLELRDAWSGDILGSASVSSTAISDTGFEWHSFSFADVELNDGQTYYIRISTDAADDEILIRHFDSNQHSGGAYIQNGTAEASGWDLAFKISEEDGSNTAPTVNNPLVDQAANEDTPFSYTVPSNTFSEPDSNDTFSYRAQLAGGGSLDWLVFNEITREFTGTPRNTHVGTWTVEVIATDNHGASTSDFFDIVVNNTNDDPYVNVGLGDQAVTEDNAFSYTVPTDAFGDDDSSASLTYSAQLSGGGALPAWLTFDTGTNTFSGTPTSADVGTVSVEVTADDGQGGTSATDTFDIVVNAAASSGAQIHESTGAAITERGVSLSQLSAQTFTVSGVGTYEIDSVAVQLRYNQWATDQAPQTITVSLLNDFNGTVLGSDTLSSADLTTSLEWYSFNFSAVSLTHGQQYYIKIEASAGDSDPLVFTGVHETNVYNNGNYVFNSGTPEPAWDLAFELSSGTNNYPVVANPIPDQSTPEETTYIYEIPSTIFNDLDGDTLTLSAELANGDPLPGWLNFNAVTNELWGTPDDGNVGTLDIRIIASDGNGGTASDTFNLTITNVNDDPHVALGLVDQNAEDNSPFSYTFPANTFGDGDVDSLAYTAELSGGGALPAWLRFDSTSRTFSGTPATSDVSTISIDVTADDGNGGTVTDTFTLTVTDTNDAPIITSNGGGTVAYLSAAENQTAVTAVTSSDFDSDVPAFSIVGGADAALFSIDSNTGIVTFNSAPDFESAADADTDNVYQVQVRASDGSLTDDQILNITVTNVNEAPAITSNGGTATASVNAAENQTSVTTVVATDVDGDTPTFSISGGADSALFNIDASTGALTFASAPNFESATDANTDGVYEVEVTVSDGNGGTDIQTISVTVTNINEAPVITSNGGGTTAAVNAAENQSAVTTVTASDVDGDTPTFSISGGADSALFNIDASTGALTFASAPDFESTTDANTDGVYEVEVTVSDGNGGTDIQTISVTVTDVNEAPVITSNGGSTTASVNAAENQTAVTTVTASDADGDTPTFSISGGPDAGLFSVDSNTGELIFDSVPDYENFSDSDTNGEYIVEVTASDDNGGIDVQTITVTVTDINEAPMITSSGGGASASINATENQTAVATVTATDADSDTPTFSISGGADAALFTIDASTGELTFDNAPDFESRTDTNADGIYEVQVRASDGTLFDDQLLSITVTNINETPVITSNGGSATASVSAAENQTSVTTVTATDIDGDTPTFSISGGVDAALFAIDAITGVLTFASSPDFESATDSGTDGIYDVEVTASDGNGGTDIQALSVTVTDVNEAPVITSNGGAATAAVDAAENQTAVTTVAATDIDGDTPTFSISGGADSALFNIDASTGALTFITAPNFESAADADTDGIYEVQVRASDGTLFDDQTLSISVTDLNEAPVVTSNGGGTIAAVNAAENQTVVTTITASDVDGDTPTFGVTGGADAALFNIDTSTGALTFTSAPDFENATDANTDGVYEVEVTANDGNGGTDIQIISVTVTGANEAPVITSNGGAATASVNAAENQAAVTTVVAADIDGDTTAFSITGGADSALFSIDGSTGVVTFASAPNFESATDANTDGVYEVEVTANDGNGGTDIQTISVTVTDVNEAPTIISNSGGTTAATNAAENQTAVTTVTASDVDSDTPTFSISGGADSALFSIDGSTGVLTFASAPNFEAVTDSDSDGVYEVEVTASDGNGGTDIQTISVTVTDANEAPAITSNSGGTTAALNAAENQTTVTTVTASDADGDIPAFSIVGGADASLFTLDASTGALTFTTAPDFETATDADTDGVYEVQVRASDGALFDDQLLSITVTNLNEAPIITSNGGGTTASINVAENQATVTTVITSDDDGDTPTFSISGGADAALFSINASTGELAFVAAQDSENPADTDTNGVYEVEITVSDGNGGTDVQTLDVTVTNTNDAPVITSDGGGSTAAISAAENQMVVTIVTASDADGDAPTFSITGGADSASFTINASTGELGFVSAADFETATDADSDGIYDVEVTANDGSGGIAIQTLSVTVTDSNDNPIVANALVDQIATEDAAFNFQFVADAFSDPDAIDTLTYNAQLANGDSLPTWLDFDGTTRTFSGTPTNGDIDSLSLVIIATDTSGASATDTFTITVTNTNDAPVVAHAIPDQTATEDTAFNYQLPVNTFNDIDSGTTLTYSAQLANGDPLPPWLSFDSVTGIFSGTPANSDVGTVSIEVTAGDGNGGTATDEFVITVSNLNDPPTVANPIPNQAATEDTAFAFQFASNTFVDMDVGDTLSYNARLSNGDPLPSWLSFDSATHTFSGIPTNSDVGTLALEVMASDASGNTVTTSFSIEVSNANDAPTVSNTLVDQMATEDVPTSFQIPVDAFADMDTGDTLSYSAQLADGTPLPSWLHFDVTTRTFSGAPTNADVGMLVIEVTANDGSGGSVTDTFTVTVSNTNDAPVVLNPIANQTLTEGMPLNFQFDSTVFGDEDGDSLIFSAGLSSGDPLPPWLSFDSTSRTFSGTPAHADVGAVTISLTASDTQGGTVETQFTVTVTGNSIPTTSGLEDITNTEDAAGDTQNLLTAFDDAESGAAQLTYTVIANSNPTLISGTIVDAVNGRLQLEYAENQFGSSVITVQATDPDGASVTTSFTVTLTPVNDNPVAVGASPLATVVDLATPATSLNILGAFDDVEDGRNLVYTISGNSNPSVAQVVAVDSENGLFIISHSGTLPGTADITVRATDSEGAWIERSVRVHIQGTVVTQPERSDGIPDNDTDLPETPTSPTTPESPAPDGGGNDGSVQPPPPPPSDDNNVGIAPTLDPLLVNLGPAPEILPMTDYAYQTEEDSRDRNQSKSEREVDREMMEPTVNDYQLISLAPPPGGYLNEQDMSDFQDAIDRARQSMTEAFEEEQRKQDAVAAVTISFTTGLVIWSLRASSLLLTLFSMLPLWRGIDPLPVLENVKRRKKELEQQRRDRLKEDGSAREVGYLFDQPTQTTQSTFSSNKSRKAS